MQLIFLPCIVNNCNVRTNKVVHNWNGKPYTWIEHCMSKQHHTLEFSKQHQVNYNIICLIGYQKDMWMQNSKTHVNVYYNP